MITYNNMGTFASLDVTSYKAFDHFLNCENILEAPFRKPV